MKSERSDTAHYFVNVRAFPINIDLHFTQVAAEGIEAHVSLPADDRSRNRASRRIRFERKRIASFVYNDRFLLEGVLTCESEDAFACDRIVFQFLPTGCLAVLYIHQLDESELRGIEKLRQTGEERYVQDLITTGMVFDIVESLAASRAIKHCPILPYDVLDMEIPADGKLEREKFEAEMEWRAWASDNYVCISACETDDDWLGRQLCDQAAELESGNGRFCVFFNNYFGWALRSPSAGNLDDDCALIATELEPIAYMISRRSVCASGIRNIKDLSRAFVWELDPPLSVPDMRRYVSAARLALMAPREYEESTEKRARRIYLKACENLNIDYHVAEFNEGINAVVQELRGVQAERDEKDAKRLNRFALIITCVFGMTSIADISNFISPDTALLTPVQRVGVLVSATAVLALVLWRIMRRRR